MKALLAVASLTLLSGCVTFGQFDEGLDALMGQHINVAIDKIGFPNGEREIAGRKIYQWGRNSTGMAYMPTTSNTYGNVYSGTRSASYNATTTGGYMMPVSYNCSLTLEVDKQEIIRRYNYDGNLGGCSGYIKALKKQN